MSSASSERSSSAAQSQASIDGDHLYQLACVETFVPLASDITPVAEPVVSAHAVACIDYTPNFQFIYGLYRSLRSCIEYADGTTAAPSPPQQPLLTRGASGEWTGGVIRTLYTSPARWLLLLGFALRQCTSNYTVWKDRRDVIMSPSILQHCTRDQLPPLSLPEALLAADRSADSTAASLTAAEAKRKKVEEVAQHWLPGTSDLYWAAPSRAEGDAAPSAESRATLSPWRAVHWELGAVGCFTRFYHKNFQVWHHRRELLTYALQQLPVQNYADSSLSPTAATTSIDGAAASEAENQDASPNVAAASQPLLASEEAFSAYLEQHHGLRYADVDERATVKAVLLNEDSKNYHAWLHFTWYLHAIPFLLQLPTWAELADFAASAAAAAAAVASQSTSGSSRGTWTFRVDPDWAFVTSESGVSCPTSSLPTLPPSPFTTEVEFTSQLIAQDCLNNSAWCHRFSLFQKDLLGRLVRQHLGSAKAHEDSGFLAVVHALCMVEVNYALQWLLVDPTNEAAYTHARAVALLYYTVDERVRTWRSVQQHWKDGDAAGKATEVDASSPASAAGTASREGGADAPTLRDVCVYLRDAPLVTPAAAAGYDLCANAEESTVSCATPARRALLQHQRQHPLSWSDCRESFSIVLYMMEVLHEHVRPRVAELEQQAARVLRAAASAKAAHSSDGSSPSAASMTLVNTLYERGSQYMLDNFHQVDAAQYLACQTVLEELWTLHLTSAQRQAVHKARPAVAYKEGVKAAWLSKAPWSRGDEENVDEDETDAGEEAAPRVDDRAVEQFLCLEALALSLAKRLTVLDPIRFKYWKFETMNTMLRGYGRTL